jgi:hypothetical protein
LDNNDGHSIVSTLKEAHPLMSMSLTRQLAEPNELVASRISLDRSTGLCPVTQAQQRLIILEPEQRTQLHNDLLKLSTEQSAKFAGRKADDSPTRAQEQLQLFSNWLDQRQGEPFTAIVDGANVGYYMQSFDRGRFNYYQIQFMVDTLEGRGENPLVVIPNVSLRAPLYNLFFVSHFTHPECLHRNMVNRNSILRRGSIKSWISLKWRLCKHSQILASSTKVRLFQLI